MSPTYWTASQIKIAARANGWKFIPCVDGKDPWGMEFGSIRVMLWEDRRGGLRKVVLTHLGFGDVVSFDHRYRNKRDMVLSWLTEGVDWKTWGFRP